MILIFPIFQMRKLGLTEVQKMTANPTVSKWQTGIWRRFLHGRDLSAASEESDKGVASSRQTAWTAAKTSLISSLLHYNDFHPKSLESRDAPLLK